MSNDKWTKEDQAELERLERKQRAAHAYDDNSTLKRIREMMRGPKDCGRLLLELGRYRAAHLKGGSASPVVTDKVFHELGFDNATLGTCDGTSFGWLILGFVEYVCAGGSLDAWHALRIQAVNPEYSEKMARIIRGEHIALELERRAMERAFPARNKMRFDDRFGGRVQPGAQQPSDHIIRGQNKPGNREVDT